MSTDEVRAYLDDVAKRYEVFGESDAMPRLLAAVKDALDKHRSDGATEGFCDGCGMPMPCPTYEAISRAFLGEGER